MEQSKMRLKGWLPNSLKSRKVSLLNSLQNRKGSLLQNVKYSSIKHQTQLNTKHQKTLSYLMKEVLFWSIFLFSSRSVPSPEFWTISQKLEYTLIREGCQKRAIPGRGSPRVVKNHTAFLTKVFVWRIERDWGKAEIWRTWWDRFPFKMSPNLWFPPYTCSWQPEKNSPLQTRSLPRFSLS